MKKLDDSECKSYLTSMLKDFDAFCRSHAINYSIAYGTLLGAVRHKGFIPWDDDIDVMMTRENYDRFLKCFTETDDYYLLTNNAKDYNLLFSKFVSKKTLVKSIYRDRYKNDLGLYIDIFPMDYLSDSFNKGLKILKRNKLNVALLVSAQWGKFYINRNVSWFRQIIRFPFFIISRFVNSKKIIRRIESKITKNQTKYTASYCGISSLIVYESDIFNEYEDIAFNGINVLCIKEKEKYLKARYGSYLNLPPESKRINPHSFEAYIK